MHKWKVDMIHKIAQIVKLLFCRVSVERILTQDNQEKIWYCEVNSPYLQDLMMTYHREFTDTETDFQIQEVSFQMDKNKGQREENICADSLDVFNALFYYVHKVLIFHENKVSCKYNELLEWREIAKALGEDLLIVALLVQNDTHLMINRRNFAWPPTILHNNNQLKRILDQGIADNHFHLRGSSPYFHVSWLNLVNHPERMLAKSKNQFAKIEENCRNKQKKFERVLKPYSVYNCVLCAVLIRTYLCCKIIGAPLTIREDRLVIGSNSSALSLNAGNSNDKRTVLDLLENLLAAPEKIDSYVRELQIILDTIRLESRELDFMLQYAPNEYFEDQKDYVSLSGERWFLYVMLLGIFTENNTFCKREYQLFYAYLRLKNEFYAEMIQSNDLLGFHNFQVYQKRKSWFTHMEDFKISEGRLARMAVRNVLNNPAVKALEVRIVPGNSSEENMINIKGYDNAILNSSMKMDQREQAVLSLLQENKCCNINYQLVNEKLKQRFYYVMHFTKEKDTSASDSIVGVYRHYTYRKKVRKKTNELLRFRNEYPQYACRVVGIDACGQELGCRPEVFASAFRLMKNYISPYPSTIQKVQLPQLKVTYHVGEEFLDVVDGLRAIDEAIRFLDLSCGDRLGHALALGIDVKKWYQVKTYQVSLTLQDYLDNVVWLHHALIKFNIKDMSSLKGWLEEQYSQYFSYIYQRCIQEAPYMKQEDSYSLNYQGSFDINTYYLAGLLRGDDPELYKSGKFQKSQIYVDQWEHYAVNMEYLRSDDIRYIPEVSRIYYMYHYDGLARKRGQEKKTFNISQNYIDGVIAVQKAMQELIVRSGIAIEMNPSSNVSIGAIANYGEHPIKALYNHGLVKNEKELLECPQINVSINTDDMGVFATRVENEYALLACSLEREFMQDGVHRYKREFIYEWLDNIRKMGLRQVFISDQED